MNEQVSSQVGPRQLDFSQDRSLPTASPASPNRNALPSPGHSSFSSPVCMEPATSYVGSLSTSGGIDNNLGTAGEAWMGSEPDRGMMAFSSTAMPSSMDADLALAIALQVTAYLRLFGARQTYATRPCRRQRRRRKRHERCKKSLRPLSGYSHPIKV